MYGLMRARHCALSLEQSERHRFHYCGTCKTVGRLYGQRARLLLNHDAVFLAELLTLLSVEPSPRNSDNAYLSYNCLSLPKSEDKIPVALQWAAAANLMLARFKVADRIKDNGQIRWRLVRRFFSGGFQRAEALLRRFDFPVDDLLRMQDRQDEREAAPISPRRNPVAVLRRLASPTAAATAMVFAHGVRAVGRLEVVSTTRRLGYDFGRLIYLLDAFEDYEKDWRKGEFNALRAAFGWTTERLTIEQRRQAQYALLEIRGRIVNRISVLPVPESYAKLFPGRLDDNLSRKIGRPLPVLTPRPRACQKRPLTLAERWENAVSFSRRMMHQEDGAWLKASLAFISVLAVVFLVPHAASRLKTWRDCWSLGFNLMFLSALPGAVLAVVTPTPDTAANEEKKGRESNWCECCGEGVEGGIEGCCECGCNACCEKCCHGCCDCCGCDCS